MSAFTPARAAQIVASFDSSGIHRVGTPGDMASGEFLAAQARACGARVARTPVNVDRTIVDEAYIECNSRRIDGLPMFDSPATTEITGTLVANKGAGDIGHLELPPNSASIKHMRFEQIRRATKHKALVVATRVTGESLAPINAQYYDAPFGPPVLLVAGAQHEFLASCAQIAAPTKLVSVHHREPVQSFNIEAHIDGAGKNAAPLAVVTPRTGWWESTAERAGGLVAWLAAIDAAAELRAQNKLACDVRTYATCGHELGHLGLSEFLQREAALIRSARHFLIWARISAARAISRSFCAPRSRRKRSACANY